MTVQERYSSCEEYQRALAANPAFEGGAEHLAGCAGCRHFRDDMLALDARIERALTVPVPELRLPELDDTGESGVVPMRRRRPGLPGWLAMAASVLLAVLVGWRFLSPEVADASLAEQIVEHLAHETFSIKVSDRAVSEDRLARVVPANVAALDPDDALITYAQSCVINGHSVPHLVMQGEKGPVTILLMPDEPVDAPQEIDSGQFRGVILPVGDGSIAIVGNDPEDLERLQQKVRSSVTWTI